MQEKIETGVESKQTYVEMTLQKRQQLVEITEGNVVGGPGISA